MYSHLLNPVTTVAAVFWRSWSLLKELFEHPPNSELQLSHLEVENAWTRFTALF